MRKFSYWFCFALVAIPNVFGYAAWLLSLAGVTLPWMGTLSLFMSFGSLVPIMLAPLLPRVVVFAVGFVMLFLVLRRLWLLVAKREGLPHSFVGAPKVLAYIGVGSLSLGVIVLVLSMLLRAGSGVPGAMLLLPAVLCVPWAFFLTEALSFRAAKSGEV
jgi:hypothetical protein